MRTLLAVVKLPVVLDRRVRIARWVCIALLVGWIAFGAFVALPFVQRGGWGGVPPREVDRGVALYRFVSAIGVLDENGAVRVVPDETDSWGEPRYDLALRLVCWDESSFNSYWAPVRWEKRIAVYEWPRVGQRSSATLDEQTKARYRRALLEYMRSAAPDEWLLVEGVSADDVASAMLTGPVTGSRIFWPGLAHTALTAIAGLAFVWLVVLEACAAWVVSRRRRRQRGGLCLHCAYDVRNVAPGGVCPECGRLMSRAGSTPPRGTPVSVPPRWLWPTARPREVRWTAGVLAAGLVLLTVCVWFARRSVDTPQVVPWYEISATALVLVALLGLWSARVFVSAAARSSARLQFEAQDPLRCLRCKAGLEGIARGVRVCPECGARLYPSRGVS